MNAKLVWAQLGRLFLAGSVATLIAILVYRRFGSGIIAAGFGLVIGILLCDLKKTGAAAVHCWTHGAKWILVPLQFTIPISLLADVLIRAFDMFAPNIPYVPIGMRAIYVFALLGGIGVVVVSQIFHYQRKSRTDSRSLAYRPLTRALAAMGVTNWSWIPDLFLEPKTVDANGKFISWKGVGHGFLVAWTVPAIFLGVVLAGILSPLIILDALFTAFFQLLTSQSVSCGLGVVIGFSIYYFWPSPGSDLRELLRLVSCSLLGGVAGSLMWLAKSALDECRPKWIPAFRSTVLVKA